MKAEGRRFKQNRFCPVCGMLVGLLSLLASTGCESMGRAGGFARNLIDNLSGRTPLNAARLMESQYAADERRNGINELSDRSFGRKEPYTTRYQQIAESDPDWLVRATAIRALNRSRDASATPIFIRALADEHPIVRVEAAKALSNIPDPNATTTLVRLVADVNQDRDVRIWSAAALRHYRTADVARTLASQLGGREFAIAWQSRRSLRVLTGQDLRYNEQAWLEYLANNPLG